MYKKKKISDLSPSSSSPARDPNEIQRNARFVRFVFANKMASSDKETVLCFLKRDFVCAAAERKNKIRPVCMCVL